MRLLACLAFRLLAALPAAAGPLTIRLTRRVLAAVTLALALALGPVAARAEPVTIRFGFASIGTDNRPFAGGSAAAAGVDHRRGDGGLRRVAQEHSLGLHGGEVAAALRGAGLEQERRALRRGIDEVDALHPEMLARMLDAADLFRIGEGHRLVDLEPVLKWA